MAELLEPSKVDFILKLGCFVLGQVQTVEFPSSSCMLHT